MTYRYSRRRRRYLVSSSLKPLKTRKSATWRVSLSKVDWNDSHRQSWQKIKDVLEETITSSFRDRHMQVCLFSDVSRGGWTYVCNTQCKIGELLQPWHAQQHELLCVNSGRFTHSQCNWTVSSWDLFPIWRAAERERHLLIGNHPWDSVNDHKSLTYLINEGSRIGVVVVVAR